MLRSSSHRRRTQRQRFDPSSIGGGGDDLRSPAAGAYSTPARSSTTDAASRSNVSAGFDAADGVGPPSTNGPPSSLRSASGSVGNQLGGGVNASLPGKLSGRGKSVFMKAGEFRGVCRGEVGEWGMCLATECPFHNHVRNKVDLPEELKVLGEDEGAWFIPGRHRRDPTLRVVYRDPYLVDTNITPAARAVLEHQEMSTQDMISFMQRPENLREEDEDSQEEEGVEESNVGDGGSVNSLESFGIVLEGLEVDGSLGDNWNHSEVGEGNVVEAANAHKIALEDIVLWGNKLSDYVSGLETKTSRRFNGLRNHLRQFKSKIGSLSNRTECLEQDVGDMEAAGFSSLTDALLSLRSDLAALSLHLDEELDTIDGDFAQLQEDVAKAVNDAIEIGLMKMKKEIMDELGNDSSSEGSSDRPPVVDVNSSVLVNGTNYSLEKVVRMLLAQDKRLTSAEEAISAKNGIVFAGVSIASESAFKEFLANRGITGRELACFIDAWSLGCHETEEDMKESDATASSKAFMKKGYAQIDYTVAVSHFAKCISLYTGSAKSTALGQLIDCFSKQERFEGSDGRDGRSAEILNVFTIAKENVGTYAEDTIDDEDIINACKSNALKAVEFHSFLHKYFNDLHHKLRQRGMPEKDIRMLLSNQLHLILKTLRSIRRKAYPVSSPNVSMMDRLVRQWWVTSLTTQKMDEFIELSFEHHPVISSSFVRFLTDHLASAKPAAGQDDKALKKLIDDAKKAMEDQVKQLSMAVQTCKDKQELILKHHPELLKPKKK